MKVGFIRHVPVVRDGDRVMVPSRDYLPITAWTDHFDRAVLIRPEIVGLEDLSDFRTMPENVSAMPLFSYQPGKHRPARIKWLINPASAEKAFSQVDAVCFRMTSWEGLRAWDAAEKSGVATLVEIHGDSHEGIRNERYSNPLMRAARGPLSAYVHQKLLAMSREADVLCTVGEALKRKYSQGRECHVTTAHQTVEKDFFEREKHKSEGPFRILFVGNLQVQKGVAFLFEALAAVRRKGIDGRLELIGGGPEEGRLRVLAKKLGIEESIEWRGLLSFGPEIIEAYRRADLFVLPSISSEGVPRVIQEAMANTCPVVATFVGSVPEQLGYGAFGSIVPPRDTDAMSGAIVELLRDPARRTELASRAFHEAMKHSFEKQKKEVGGIAREFIKVAEAKKGRG